MQTWIERVDATDSLAVRPVMERWKGMIRAGWLLTVLHHYRPTPTLRAFGYLPDDPVPRPDFGYPPGTVDDLSDRTQARTVL